MPTTLSANTQETLRAGLSASCSRIPNPELGLLGLSTPLPQNSLCRLEKPHYKAWSFPLLILTYHTTAESTEPSLEKNSNKPVYWLNLWFPQTIVNVKVVHKTFVKEMKMPFLSPPKKKRPTENLDVSPSSDTYSDVWSLAVLVNYQRNGSRAKK